MNPTQAPPKTAITCPRCDNWWTGYGPHHCAAEQSAFGQLFALGDGNAGLGADWDAHPLEGAVDRSGVTGQLLADFVSAQSLRVEHRRLRPPRDSGVFESMVIGGHWSKVRWSIVGAVVIDVVNVLSVSDPSVEHPVLVGFDVLVRRDPPTKPHVTMRGDVHSQATRHCLEPVAAGLVDARRNYPCWSLPGSDTGITAFGQCQGIPKGAEAADGAQ